MRSFAVWLWLMAEGLVDGSLPCSLVEGLSRGQERGCIAVLKRFTRDIGAGGMRELVGSEPGKERDLNGRIVAIIYMDVAKILPKILGTKFKVHYLCLVNR